MSFLNRVAVCLAALFALAAPMASAATETWTFAGPGPSFGYELATAGDLTGDGLHDLLTAGNDAPDYSGRLRPFMLPGRPGIGHHTATTADAFALGSSGSYARFASAAGDFNGDGHQDVTLCTFSAVWVVFGGPAYGDVKTANIDNLGARGLKILPYGSSGSFWCNNARGGLAVGSAQGGGAGVPITRDVNADGKDDLLLVHDSDIRRATVVFGSTATGTLSLNALGGRGFHIHDSSDWSYGEIGDLAHIIGDVNGDGRADLAMTDQRPRAHDDPARVYVVYGKLNTFTVDVGPMRERSYNGAFGYSIRANVGGSIRGGLAPLADFDGDGIGDFAFTDPADQGHLYVIYGKAGRVHLDTAALAPADGFAVPMASPRFVSGLRDMDGDGRHDLAVGWVTPDNWSRVGIAFSEGRAPAAVAEWTQMPSNMTSRFIQLDFDGVGRQEVAIAWSQGVWIFNGVNDQAPSFVTTPVVPSESFLDGDAITIANEAEGSAPIDASVTWERCRDGDCTVIADSHELTHRATAEDIGHTLRAQVKLRNLRGAVNMAAEGETGVIKARPAAPGGGAWIAGGPPRVGKVLRAEPGTWTGTRPMTFRYQWRRCAVSAVTCEAIPGATGREFTPRLEDVGQEIEVAITGVNVLGAGGTATPRLADRVLPDAGI